MGCFYVKCFYRFIFSDVIWVIVAVDEGGLLGVTQQLSQFGKELGSPHKINQSTDSGNPFGLSSTSYSSPQPCMSVPNNSPVIHQETLVRRPLFTVSQVG